jgi:hypothetical protein
MSEIYHALPIARESVCAVMRIVLQKHRKRRRKGKPAQKIQVSLAFVGTAWCIVESKLLVTAYHVLNGGQPRDSDDRFYIFTVPGNDREAFHFPVIGFPLEDPKSDMAVLEIGKPVRKGQKIPCLPVTFAQPADGSRVLTIGFPAPEISYANVSPAGEFLGGGQFFLKSHANEGIVSAHYNINGSRFYEFNVGWHHGESGGPVLTIDEEPAVFSIMQHYRNVKSPHGILAGPHRGISIEVIKDRLVELGAEVV